MKHFKLVTSILCLPLLFSISLNKNNDGAVSSVAYSQRRLEKYQQNAISMINNIDLDNYRTKEAEEIAQLITQTSSRITSSNDYDEIDAIVSSYNRYILTIKTNAQLTKEEQEANVNDNTVYYISSLSDLLEFRDDVNDGYNYSGETVKLTQDIVIPSGQSFGTPIGSTEAKAFAGVFDGQNHKIVNLKISAATCAFIYFGTNCTIKNLSFENVNITATTQRAAAVISRADGVRLENVNILSGTITGPTQSGGLIGASLGNSGETIITNCSNAASINTTGTNGSSAGAVGYVYNGSLTINNFINTGAINSETKYAGGILGQINSLTTSVSLFNCTNTANIMCKGFGASGISCASSGLNLNIEDCSNTGNITNAGEGTGGVFGYCASVKTGSQVRVKNCTNSGIISGQSNGTGGVVGAHNANASYITFIVEDCTNHGTVNGVNYTGGVIGLIRNSTESSYIDKCYNYGNVTASSTSGTVGCGGIVGTARVNITNCGCYTEAILSVTAKSITKKASELNEKGTPGYIALNYETNCKVHTNNILINLDGTAYN